MVSYKGVVDSDASSTGSGQILYPAPNAVGFLAAVVTHGVLVEATRKSQKHKQQETADAVLSPYQAILGNYTHRELMQQGTAKMSAHGRKKLIGPTDAPGEDWLIESAPVFSMTQDQTAIVLENRVSIRKPDAPSVAFYSNVVTVVSQARDGPDRAGFWTTNDGQALKEASASLFAESLDIALGEMARGQHEGDRPHKTIRYLEGAAEKMERGQIISEVCDRVVIKTLRGWLMSVPAKRTASSPIAVIGCAEKQEQLR